MTRFRPVLLGFTAVAVVALTLVSNFSSPNTDVFTNFTPPGRVVLASFPAPVQPRGEIAEPTGNTPAPLETQVADHAATPAVKPPATKNIPAPQPTTTKAPAATATPSTNCPGTFSQQFLCLFNQYRISKGLSRVSANADLANVALKHSQWMDSNGIFSHEESNGSHLLDRCRAAGIICRAENLAENATSAQNLLDMWIASPSHNANLIGPYSTMGLGIAGSYITLLLN